MYARDFRRLARESLRGSWPISILVAFLAALLGGSVVRSYGVSFNFEAENIQFLEKYPQILRVIRIYGSIASLLSLVAFIFGGVIRLGHCRYLLNQQDRKPTSVSDLFSRFSYFGNGFCLQFLTILYTVLWSLLGFIPGIVASYRYAMAPFIQVEHPEYSASECINASREMMHGHKLELFHLDISFFGWHLLCALTLGIGSIFLAPYTAAASAAFYRQYKPEDNIVDAL